MGVRLGGRPAAVVALAIYLFFLCTEHCWACATYSPWLFTSTFSQGLFFTSVLALLAASTRPRWLPAAAAGTLAGLTFLSHTASALLLGILGVALLGPKQLAAYAGAALLVASPFLAAIVGHYHLRIANAAPLAWDYGPLLWPAILGTIRSNIVWFAGAAVGLVWLHARVVVVWLAAAALRRLSRPEEVVLGTHGAANLIIGPAGRKVVAPHPFTSNPYVELGTRTADRDRMLKAVQEHDLAAFRPLAERYAVSLVVMVGGRECDAAQTFEAFVPQERLGDVCLSRVRFPP